MGRNHGDLIFNNLDAGGKYEANSFGGGLIGLIGSFSYYPFWFLSIGADLGFRILISQGLKEIN